MVKDIGTHFQDELEDRWNGLGKNAWISRFTDQKDLVGLNGGAKVYGATQPADFLAAYAGWMGLIECKATGNPTGLSVSSIRKPQWIAATRVTAAGACYIFAIKNENTKEVFFVPASFMLLQRGVVKWDTILLFKWLGGKPSAMAMRL